LICAMSILDKRVDCRTVGATCCPWSGGIKAPTGSSRGRSRRIICTTHPREYQQELIRPVKRHHTPIWV
jgi:hypothetical protein